MYDRSYELLNRIKSMYVNSLACVRVKGSERGFSISAIQGCIMSPWLFNVYMDAVMKEINRGDRRRRE